MSDTMSVVSEPSHRPSGVSSFNIRAVVKDPQLRQRFICNDPQLATALRSAGINTNAKIGALLKHASRTRLDEHHYTVIDSYKVSCESDWGQLDPQEDYVGMVLYSKDGDVDWHLNGHHCKSGYIYFRKTTDIEHYQSDHGQVHGKLYVSLFDEEPDEGLIASGFAIRQGLNWRFNSGTFNHWQQQYKMGRSEQTTIKAAIQRFAATGEMVYPIANRREVFLTSAEVSLAELSQHMGRMLISEGQRGLNAGRPQSNTIHFEVRWRRRSRDKSINMRQPNHHMVYQLMLDIQARTGFRADRQILFLEGSELQWWQRLCSVGLSKGDVIVLQLASESVQPRPLPDAGMLSGSLDDLQARLQSLTIGALPAVAE